MSFRRRGKGKEKKQPLILSLFLFSRTTEPLKQICRRLRVATLPSTTVVTLEGKKKKV